MTPFHYAQRSVVGPSVNQLPAGSAGFSFQPRSTDPDRPPDKAPTPTPARPGTMTGVRWPRPPGCPAGAGRGDGGGVPGGFGLALSARPLQAAGAPRRHGWVDFGPAGGSYYYSRTTDGGDRHDHRRGARLAGHREAWFDHQWGDFIAVGGGGWDWFAVNLADGTDVTLSMVRDADGTYPLVYGTLVRPDGTTAAPRASRLHRHRHRPLDDPRHGRDLPGGLARSRSRGRASHRPAPDRGRPGARHARHDGRRLLGGVAGRSRATRDGGRIGGEAYVELTGYGPGCRPRFGRPSSEPRAWSRSRPYRDDWRWVGRPVQTVPRTTAGGWATFRRLPIAGLLASWLRRRIRAIFGAGLGGQAEIVPTPFGSSVILRGQARPTTSPPCGDR